MTVTCDVHAYQDPAGRLECQFSGSELYWLRIGHNATIMLTPNQALVLRDALANNPELCAYETECQREDEGRDQGNCVGDMEGVR